MDFHVRGLNQKLMWGGKPGIAVQYTGCEKFRQYLRDAKDSAYLAVAVPDDHATRWKARKRRF